jgi:hypothetical protein
MEESTDDITYDPVSVQWCQIDKDNSTGISNGSYLPVDIGTARTRALIGATDPLTASFTKRYLRFIFFSDNSTAARGWNIELTSTNAPSGTTYPIGTPLYTDPNDYTKVTNVQGPAETLVGYVATLGSNPGDNTAFLPF